MAVVWYWPTFQRCLMSSHYGDIYPVTRCYNPRQTDFIICSSALRYAQFRVGAKDSVVFRVMDEPTAFFVRKKAEYLISLISHSFVIASGSLLATVGTVEWMLGASLALSDAIAPRGATGSAWWWCVIRRGWMDGPLLLGAFTTVNRFHEAFSNIRGCQISPSTSSLPCVPAAPPEGRSWFRNPTIETVASTPPPPLKSLHYHRSLSCPFKTYLSRRPDSWKPDSRSTGQYVSYIE